jgi:hypothetical protein
MRMVRGLDGADGRTRGAGDMVSSGLCTTGARVQARGVGSP